MKSIRDIYKIGKGPSSSHTMGPERAAKLFKAQHPKAEGFKVILYGSYARGEQTEESDVDIAVILKDGNTEKMHDDMLDIVVDYELDLDVTLSVVPIEYANYLEWNKVLPFYQNIEKEGIVLWQAA